MEVTWNNDNLVTVNPALTGVQAASQSGTTSVTACECTTLPVELISFQAELQGKTSILKWSTASEENNAGFEIQRSVDREDFRKIGWLSGQGNTGERIDYSFVDKNMQSNVQYYYRLKQIDYDGRFDYSQIVTSILKDVNGFVLEKISPNPSEAGFTTVRILSIKDQDLEVTVINNLGKLLITNSISIGEGINFYKLNVNDLAPGVYFVKITNGEQSNFKRLIIQ